MTAHAERVGVLVLLALLMMLGWCAFALGVSADSEATGARTIGAVVSKRDGSTTIVIGGPFAAAAIVVSHDPEPVAARARADEPSDAVPDAIVASAVPTVSGGTAVPDTSAVPDVSVAEEAEKILADSAALEELWRLPAATADQRGPVAKQA
jgi:hypothetical protein